MRNVLLLLLVFVASVVSAQDQPLKEFPPDLTTPNAQVLQDYLAGKTLVGRFASGVIVTTQFAADGKLKSTISTGGVDSGDWKVEDGKLCGSLRKAGSFCNDARLGPNAVWLRRMNGEIVKYEPQ